MPLPIPVPAEFICVLFTVDEVFVVVVVFVADVAVVVLPTVDVVY